MTELLCDPQSALLFLEGQDNYYEVANWTEDGEEKVPDRANRVKNKKKSKKKKKAEAPQKEEVKNVDEKSNRANGAKIGSLSAMAKPFVPSTFAESYPFPTGTDFGSSYGVPAKRLIVQQASEREKRQSKKKKNSSNVKDTETTLKDTKANLRRSRARDYCEAKTQCTRTRQCSSTISKKNGLLRSIRRETVIEEVQKRSQKLRSLHYDRAVSKLKVCPIYHKELSNIVGEGSMTRADAISKL